MKKVIALLILLLFLTSCRTTIEVKWGEFWEDSTDVQEYYIEDIVINNEEYEKYQIFNEKIIFYVQKDTLEDYLLMIDFDEGCAFVGLISNQQTEPVKGYYFIPKQWESEKEGFIYIDEFGGYYCYEWIFDSTIDGDFIIFTDEDNPIPMDMEITESIPEQTSKLPVDYSDKESVVFNEFTNKKHLPVSYIVDEAILSGNGRSYEISPVDYDSFASLNLVAKSPLSVMGISPWPTIHAESDEVIQIMIMGIYELKSRPVQLEYDHHYGMFLSLYYTESLDEDVYVSILGKELTYSQIMDRVVYSDEVLTAVNYIDLFSESDFEMVEMNQEERSQFNKAVEEMISDSLIFELGEKEVDIDLLNSLTRLYNYYKNENWTAARMLNQLQGSSVSASSLFKMINVKYTVPDLTEEGLIEVLESNLLSQHPVLVSLKQKGLSDRYTLVYGIEYTDDNYSVLIKDNDYNTLQELLDAGWELKSAYVIKSQN